MNPFPLLAIQQYHTFPKHRQMAGDLRLRLFQRRTEIAHAQLSHLSKQQHDTQAGFIGEVFEEL